MTPLEIPLSPPVPAWPAAMPSLRDHALERLAAGHGAEAQALIAAELQRGGDAVRWLSDRIVEAMTAPDLRPAGVMAAALAAHQRGPAPGDPATAATRRITLPKLRHDIAQYRLLRGIGALGPDFDATIAAHEAALARHAALGENASAPMDALDLATLDAAYGRIVHREDAPRLPGGALAAHWDRDHAQRTYLSGRTGVLVIDDFLAPEALARLERFCLRSTCWFGNRYADGRLGAFFFSGFNCPLLLQIAEEIRDALPAVIGPRYPLRQLWAFKNTGVLPPDSTIHADFAAVNVNFWITPDDANLDPDSGGMVVYDIDAPASWDFATYNERIDIIRDYLRARRPGALRVPYKRNRAIIFNSDLFHATEAVRFRDDYRSHRINVTMLYGDRADDAHRPPADDGSADIGLDRNAWRSAAFARTRRPR